MRKVNNMIFRIFGGKIVFLLKYNVNIFIIFVKFSGWIVVIWIGLTRLIGEKWV